MKPRVRFCWYCGRKLRGNHFTEVFREGHLRILHKICAESPQIVATDSDLIQFREEEETSGGKVAE